MARNTYAAEIREIFAGLNQRQRTKKDDAYRQQVLSETIRANQEKERIQRETLTNQLNIQGAYGSRAQDKTLDLEKSLTTQRYGMDKSWEVGMDRNQASRHGSNLNYLVGMDRNQASRYGSKLNYDVGMDRNQVSREGQLIDRQNVLDKLKSSELMHSDELALRNLVNRRNVGLGYDRNRITEGLGLLDIGEKRYATNQATVRTGMQTDSAETITDKRTGSAEKIAGMQIEGRADLQDDAQSFTTDYMKDKAREDYYYDSRRIDDKYKVDSKLSKQGYKQASKLSKQGAKQTSDQIEQRGDITADLQNDQQENINRNKDLDRALNLIILDKRTSSAEKINLQTNLVRKHLGELDIDVKNRTLDQQMKIFEISRKDQKEAVALNEYYKAEASSATPSGIVKATDMTGTDESQTIENFNLWHDQNLAPGIDGGMSLLKKATTLSRFDPGNAFTDDVISNYEDAFKKLTGDGMGTLLNLGGTKNKIRASTKQIRDSLSSLYRAQGYTEEEVKAAIKKLKDPYWVRQ